MIHHYQSAGERDPYVLRFGIEFRPSSNAVVWPGQTGTFVRRPRADHPGSAGSLARYEAATGRWGLIPLFSKDGNDPLFEANAESAAAERNFLQPWKRGHRCVVLVDAVFEGDAAAGQRVLRHTRPDGKALAIAGLWNGWRSPQGQCVESFTMLTVQPAEGQSPGRRLPALLHDAWLDDWLCCPVEETSAFLRPPSTADLVSTEIAHHHSER